MIRCCWSATVQARNNDARRVAHGNEAAQRESGMLERTLFAGIALFAALITITGGVHAFDESIPI
jgi:hypothetical protein